MTLEETIDLLTVAAAFDRRTIGEADAVAWHAALGMLPFTDARAAVVAHYSRSSDWIMPADVRKGVTAIRDARIAKAPVPVITSDEASDPAAYREALADKIRRSGDGEVAADATGRPALRAITGGAGREEPREKHEPESMRAAIEEIRKILGPARARSRLFGDSRRIAAQQAEEARREREGGGVA